ncbi:PREDICTED: armadillo repeat-containing protein 6-like [Populus euphratica]|uniref:Armadillo repeat-containing protein 6-like n=1 Tax=Populus euphratica TaxID=75702 RepID=A0AAJ6SYU7_POPEU|nr:PREDICTED: armadillo repeat-containing protein 6-like [Populus euphratica]
MSARNATPVISPDRQQTPQNDNNAIEQEAEEESKTAVVLKNPSYMDREGPPLDDCCPICFGTFDVPCKASCGHWYCGSCILQYWKYSGPSSRCKCPMCSSRISNLTPEASLHGQQGQEVVKVLEDVRRYNHVFVGGVRGLARKVHVVPFLFKRMLEEMMDPDGHNFFLYEKLMRMFAIFLAILYISSPFDFIPLGRIGVVRLFEYMSMLLAVTLRLAGIFRRRRLNQQETFMGPPSKNVRTISQEAFDELVKENIEDLGLDPTEALEDAIQTLTLQGVDLSGIVTCVPGEGNVRENPVIKCLERLKELGFDDDDLDEMVGLLDELVGLFTGVEGSGNVAIGVRNGGLELVCSICSSIPLVSEKVLVSALKTLALLIHDVQSTEMFRSSDGPKMVVGILKDGSESLEVLNTGFAVVAAAATGNEVVKELLIELKIDELILEVLNRQSEGNIQGLYDSIRVLLTPDDNRVVASQVYGYARRFAKIGIARALVESLRSGLTSPSLVSASIALKAVAVNDEICKSIAESGGIDVIFKCIDDSGERGNKIVARACCSLLSKLAGSDSNKSAIVEKEGMNKLIQLSARFSDDPSVLQEVMSIFTVLCLRSPDTAARAMEAGAGDLAIQAMEKFSNVQQLQRSSCLMIRNLVARNPENRTLLLSHGIEKIIRRAKANHETCKDAATDALRDLGLDNYNS